MPSDNKPRSVMERMFSTRKSPAGKSLDQSMLDLVKESAATLRKNVSQADQRILEEYLDGIRALEKRVVAMEHQQAKDAEAQAKKDKPRSGTFSDPIEITLPAGSNIPRGEHVRLMADLMILAFQADVTRVVTLPFCLPYDGSTYPELGFTEDFHACTHMAKDSEKHLKIDQFHLQQFNYVLQRMKGIKDGVGTLLDNSIVVFGSGMADWSHDCKHNLPTIVAGRGGGTINPGGRYIQAQGNMGDLLTSVLTLAGCTLSRPFGNGTKQFPGLS
ncbi:MAG: DUF1552 domain-containing protein [Acidobacteria bacterium]|nr:DUF1552 domain-containing protein [Acidobacteriota bacterium]